MKRNILLLLACTLSFINVQAQDHRLPKEITLANGNTVSFLQDEIDSARVILTPDKDTLGIKVYCKGKESRDFLRSQITAWTWHEGTTGSYPTTPVYPDLPPTQNDNRNDTPQLAQNKEGWRLEFPHFYTGTDKTYEITHSTEDYGITYSLEWDAAKKSNRWSCYEMYAGNMKDNVSRTDAFQPDPDIPEDEQTALSDYTHTGFSRGHLCPSGDRLCSKAQNRQTFYLSNMQPQWQNHNGTLWNNLETYVRDFAASCDTLYIVKGATIDKADQIYTADEIAEINKSNPDATKAFPYAVPKYFYMALLAYDKASDTYHTLAFWTEHTNTADNNRHYADYAIPVSVLEERTGIDFFCNLPDRIEQGIEPVLDLDYWKL